MKYEEPTILDDLPATEYPDPHDPPDPHDEIEENKEELEIKVEGKN